MKTNNWPVFILIAFFIINMMVAMGTAAVLFEPRVAFDETIVNFALILSVVLLICQILLFGIKISVTEDRPVPKRKISWTSVLMGLVMAALTFSAFMCLFLVIFTEDSPSNESEDAFIIMLFILFFGSWLFWGYTFMAAYKENLPGEFLRKMLKKVMIGSAAELIIAVQSHIVFRNRDDCCAPIVSYFGIVTGVTVLLMAFGPGIVFMYLKRMNSKKPKSQRGE